MPVTCAPLVYNTAASLSLSVPVSEDVTCNCMMPCKVKSTCKQKALEKESQQYKCALKLLPCFFTKEKLTKRNTHGSHVKEQLDSTKLKSLKAVVLGFSLDCPKCHARTFTFIS